jgi:nitrogen regulatory protein P-II 1
VSYLVVLIVDDPDDCPSILDAWESLGVSGITILESTGLGRLRRASMREDMPLIPSLRDFLNAREIPRRTLFSVVEDEETTDKMAAAAQSIIGSLDNPHTGFLFIIPVLKAFGLGQSLKNP